MTKAKKRTGLAKRTKAKKRTGLAKRTKFKNSKSSSVGPVCLDYSKPLKNPRYELFSQEYMVDLNKTQAAKRAKYSKKTAGQKGEQLFKIVEIKGRITYLQGELSKKVGVTAEMVVAEISKIAFANIQDYICEDNEVLDLSKIPRNVAAVVESVQVTRSTSGEAEIVSTKFKLYSKMAALENLGKHLGIYEKDNEQKKDNLADFLKAFKDE